jgi:hypothetical protein
MNRIFFVLLLAAAMVAPGCSKKEVSEKAKFVAKLTPIKYAPAPTSAPATGAASAMAESENKGSGEATFEMNAQGTGLHYLIKVDHVADVTGASILVEGRDVAVADLTVNRAGPASGKLAEGLIADTDLHLPPKDQSLETLLAAFRDKKATLVVFTRKNPKGELSGPIRRVTVTLEDVAAEEQQAAVEAIAKAYQLAQSTAQVPPGASREQREFYLDLAVLTKNPHRLAGFEDGSRAASQFVENRLKAMGIAKVAVQEFPLVQPQTTECRLLVDGQEVTSPDGKPAIYAGRGNLFQESITPAEGLSGQTAYLGRGTLREYGTNLPQDKIAVLDFDCGRDWLNAFSFGAKAVIFVGSNGGLAEAVEHQAHWPLPANLPRFYVTQETSDRLGLRDNTRAKQLTIFAKSKWSRMRGRNVIAFIPGTAPKPSDNADALPQTLVLAAPLDNLGEVPQFSPAAREAANLAALLQMAEYFHRCPPTRDVLVCFFDAQAQHHSGASAFYGAINRSKAGLPSKPAQLEGLLENYNKEHDFVQQIVNLFLKFNDPFSPEAQKSVNDKIYRQALLILHSEALNISGDVLEELRTANLRLKDLNDAKEALTKQLEKEHDSKVLADLQTQIKKIQDQFPPVEQKIQQVKALDNAWNKVQQDLHNKQISPDQRPYFDQLFEQVRGINGDPQKRGIYGDRLEELEQSISDTRLGMKLRDEFGPDKRQIVLHVSVDFGDARDRWIFAHGDSSDQWVAYDAPGVYKSVFDAMVDTHQSMTMPVAVESNKDCRWLWNLLDVTLQDPNNVLDDLAHRSFSHFDPVSVEQDLDTKRFTPTMYVDSGAVARLFGTLNVSMMTLLDPLSKQAQPGDTVAALKADRILTQATDATTFLRRLADQPQLGVSSSMELTATYVDAEWSESNSRLDGPSIKRVGGGSAMRSRPVRGAVVALINKPWVGIWENFVAKYPPGYQRAILAQTNMYGIYEPGLHSAALFNRGQSNYVLSATFDEMAASDGAMGGRGLIDSISSQDSWMPDALATKPVTLFKTKLKTIVGFGFDRGVVKSQIMPDMSSSPFRLDRSFVCESQNVLTLFAPADVKGFKVFNKTAWVLLSNSLTKDGKPNYEGTGFPLDEPFEHPVTCAVSAHDLLTLNDGRLNMLLSNRINEDSLQELTETARQIAAKTQELAKGFSPAGASTTPATAEATGQPDVPAASSSHYYGDMEASASLDRRVYIPLVGVMNDLVTAVVLLLLLAIPFAFALERLLIGTPHIYRQIGWFGIFFLATFGVLFFVNPAFRIAATPIIIFLAFAIILLSSLVVFIMVRKLQSEMKKMQGLSTTVHSTDVSRLSTMMAAVSMGISTMRRRPLRTLLTSATVVLLTFTILTFASFGSSWGARRTHVGPMSGSVPRIVVRQQLWSPILPGLVDTLRGHFAQRATVVPRYWVAPNAVEAASSPDQPTALDMIVSDPDSQKLSSVSAAIGIDWADIQRLRPPSSGGQPAPSDLEEQFVGRLEMLQGDGIFFTLAVSKAVNLGVETVRPDPVKHPSQAKDWDRIVSELSLPAKDDRIELDKVPSRFTKVTLDNNQEALLLIGQKVFVAGRSFTFAGVIREQMSTYNILEGSSVLPVDYTASAGSSGVGRFAEQESGLALSESPDQPNAQFVPYTIDKVAVIGSETAKALNGRVRSVHIFPRDPLDLQDIATRAASVTELPTYVGDANGVYRLIFTSLTEASGIRDLLIPVLLGGLIVFATMLGSVSDREREIYTFSSLGLAPAHVASLFFAEASMYAVIGGMGGYLLGQVVARLLNWLSTFLDFTVPSMNYSSTNAIVTVLIVMCTVLISTIYPAMKASRSANPGIQRSWKIPKPQANLYDLVFPFTVSAYDIIGVVSFLKEHFDNYTDTSLGVFATTGSGVFRQQDNDMLAFQAKVALAPFDLGVNQAFAMLSKPSDIEGINEVRILIHRMSGAQGDWERANRVFINDLRKQLLIWRSLPHEVMDHYRQVTLEQWDRLPIELVDGRSIGGAL